MSSDTNIDARTLEYVEDVMHRKEQEETELMKKRLHEYRLAKLKKAIEEEKKNDWIYVGNSFRP